MKLLLSLITILLLLKYGMSFLAGSLIFHPKKYPEGNWDTSAVSWPIKEHWITTADNLRLHSWYFPRKGSNTVILWLHGNAGNIAGRTQSAITFVKNLPVSVFLLSYRGYGKSEGKPSELGLYMDAMAAYEYLNKMKDISNIIIYGVSLGGAVGIDLATKVNPAGLVVEAGFTSIAEVGKIHYPYLPCELMVGKQFCSINKVKNINCPKLFIHGDQDDTVPFEHGKRLFEKARKPKIFYSVKGGNHNNLLDMGGREYFRQVKQFLVGVIKIAEP